MSHQLLLVLDFGSQVTQLIARRVRELGVYAEILPSNRSMLRIFQKSGYPAEIDRSPSDVRAKIRLGRRIFA